MVIYSLMSEKDTTLYERKIPTAIDSRGSIRSVGFGRSMSNRHEQLQEWYFYRGGVIRKYIYGKVKESKVLNQYISQENYS